MLINTWFIKQLSWRFRCHCFTSRYPPLAVITSPPDIHLLLLHTLPPEIHLLPLHTLPWISRVWTQKLWPLWSRLINLIWKNSGNMIVWMQPEQRCWNWTITSKVFMSIREADVRSWYHHLMWQVRRLLCIISVISIATYLWHILRFVRFDRNQAKRFNRVNISLIPHAVSNIRLFVSAGNVFRRQNLTPINILTSKVDPCTKTKKKNGRRPIT